MKSAFNAFHVFKQHSCKYITVFYILFVIEYLIISMFEARRYKSNKYFRRDVLKIFDNANFESYSYVTDLTTHFPLR